MKTDPVKDTTGAPLPWVFDGDFVVVVDCPRGQFPVVCRPLNEADGNLIAAAKHLYNCLESVVTHRKVAMPEEWYADAALALAQARGDVTLTEDPNDD